MSYNITYQESERYIINEFTISDEAQNYKNRVEDDGGEVVLIDAIMDDIEAVKSISGFDSLILGLSAYGGVGLDDTDGVLRVNKWYDISNLQNDAIQENDIYKPSFYGSFSFLLPNEISFRLDLTNGTKHLTHDAINGDFTAFYVLRQTAANKYIHSGNMSSQGVAFMFGLSADAVAPVIYKQSPIKVLGGENYPVAIGNRLITFQPDHIYESGTEVTYKEGYEETIQANGITTIGARADNLNSSYSSSSDIVAIYIFNTKLSDENRIIFETYLTNRYLVDDYSESMISELPSYEELSNWVLYEKDDIIFALRVIDDKLLFSSDGGNTYNVSDSSYSTLKFGYVFNNGTLFWVDSTKVYKSDSSFSVITEITPQDENGDAFAWDNNFQFSPFHRITSQIIDSSNEIIAWGVYPGEPKCIWASLNGDDCKMVYRFGAAYDYNITHTHSVVYNEDVNKWYIATGDAADGYINLMSAVYDGDWEFTHLLTGDPTNETKLVNLISDGADLWWSADVTIGNTDRGIWMADALEFGNRDNHHRQIGLDLELSHFIVEQDRVIIAKYDNNTGTVDVKWEILIYNRTTKKIKRYFMDGLSIIDPVSAAFPRVWKSNNGNYYFELFNNVPSKGTVKFII